MAALLLSGDGLLFICNITAGAGTAQAGWQRVHDCMQQAGFTFEYRMTEYAGHAVELAKEAVERGERDIVAVGGDGTLNEVLQGVWGNPCRIGIIPAGTGNDYARSLQIPTDPEQAAQVIMNGKCAPYDVGLANGMPFLNNAGLGIDVSIVELTARISRKLHIGKLSYILATIWMLLTYRFPEVRIWVDDVLAYEGRLMLCSMGNGQYIGGGMCALPLAKADDGLFDVCIVSRIPRWKCLFLFAKFIKGKHLDLSCVKYLNGKHVRIESQYIPSFEMDGNVISSIPQEFTIQPSAMEIFVP